MPAAVTQFRWDYVMESGIRGTTLALALRLPGDYSLPLGSRRGINQHGELAVVEQAKRAEQLTTDRDRFSFKVREPCGEGQWSVGAAVSLWPTCSVTVSQRRVAIEVAGLAVWAEAVPETKLTDEQVPLSLSARTMVGRCLLLPSAQKKNSANYAAAESTESTELLYRHSPTHQGMRLWEPSSLLCRAYTGISLPVEPPFPLVP